MKNHKRAYSVVMVWTALIWLTIVLAGCSAQTTVPSGTVQETEAAAGAPAPTEHVTIDVWNPETGEAVLKVFEEDIKAFEALHPNIKVNLVTIPWSDIYTKWQTGVQSGVVPDLSLSSAAFASSFHQQGVLEPLDDVVAALGGDDYWAPSAKSFVEMNQKDGSFFALPYVQNSVLLWYNKEMLADAGLTPPKTWDELLNAAKGLTKDGVYGILVTSSKTHVTQHSLYSLMLSNGGDIVDRENGDLVVFDSPEVIETLAFYKELSQYSPPGATGYDRPEAQAAITTGKIAMFIYGSWLGGALRQAGPEIFSQFDVVPVPTNKGRGSFMGNMSLMVFKEAQHKAEAKEFIKFLMSDEAYTKWLVTDPSSYGSVSKSAQASPLYTEDPEVKAVQNVIDASNAALPNAWVYGLPNAHAGEIEGLQIISEVAARVVVDNVDPAVAAQEGADKIREIINQ